MDDVCIQSSRDSQVRESVPSTPSAHTARAASRGIDMSDDETQWTTTCREAVCPWGRRACSSCGQRARRWLPRCDERYSGPTATTHTGPLLAPIGTAWSSVRLIAALRARSIRHSTDTMLRGGRLCRVSDASPQPRPPPTACATTAASPRPTKEEDVFNRRACGPSPDGPHHVLPGDGHKHGQAAHVSAAGPALRPQRSRPQRNLQPTFTASSGWRLDLRKVNLLRRSASIPSASARNPD